jgi:hypothetical protein
MLRDVVVLVVLGLLVAGGPIPASAQSAGARHGSADRTRDTTSPLAPGGAAGIKQAQARGGIWNFAPFALVGGLAALVVLMNDDDGDSATTTTGSN